MFGLVHPQTQSVCCQDRADWRSEYCHLCASLAVNYGFSSRMLLVYDFAALAWILVDRGDSPRAFSQNNCLRGVGIWTKSQECSPVDRFLAAISTFACGVKFEDDINDGGRTISRIGKSFYSNSLAQSRKDLESLDFALPEMESVLRRQQEVERRNEQDLELASEPTGAAYRLVAERLVQLNGSPDKTELAGEVGETIGRAVFLTDAWIDLPKDGPEDYNPLRQFNVTSGGHSQCPPILRRYLMERFFRIETQVAEASPILLPRWKSIHERFKELLGIKSRSVVLNVVCCCPCGDGAVAVDSRDADNCCRNCSGASCCLCCCLTSACKECC